MTGRPNLFYALWPDENTRAALAQLQSHVRGRHTHYKNLHLTLAFLGPQPLTILPLLRSLTQKLNEASIRIDIDRLGYFKKNRIAWAGTHDTPLALAQLQLQLAKLLEQHQIQFDRKDFKPHITLSRHAEAPSDLPFDPFIWHASQVVLAQSPLPHAGPHYRVLASQQLKTKC